MRDFQLLIDIRIFKVKFFATSLIYFFVKKFYEGDSALQQKRDISIAHGLVCGSGKYSSFNLLFFTCFTCFLKGFISF